MDTPKESGWKEEFDAKFGYIAYPLDYYTKAHYVEIKKRGFAHLQEVKAFIAQVEATAIATTEARVVEKLTKGVVKLRKGSLISPLESYRIEDQVYGYERATEDVRALFSSKTPNND
jgi:hypothetical protein